MGEDFRKQWPPVDVDFLKTLVRIHNFGKDEDFARFAMKHREKINNPDYLQVFIEHCTILPDYFEEYFDMCKLFYDFIKANPDLYRLPFSLRTVIRLGVFEEQFADFLKERGETGAVS